MSPSKSSPSKSECSQPDSSTRKRSILSNFNFRKSENFTQFEEESIVEESSSFFDETETALQKPDVISLPTVESLPAKSSYNLDAAINKENLNSGPAKSLENNAKPKRKFLKRGEGKLCVHPGARQKFLAKEAEKRKSTGSFSDGSFGNSKNEPTQSLKSKKATIKSANKLSTKPTIKKFGC